MLERYNENARRTIFFARYEASQFGSHQIEAEYILLGLMREDRTLSLRFITPRVKAETLRREIEQHSTPGMKISASVDLPLSQESQRVLGYAAEEADGLGHQFIGTEHLFLGILREERSFAARLLEQHGINAGDVRKVIAASAPPAPGPRTPTGRAGTAFVELVLKVANLDASIAFYGQLGFSVFGDSGPGTVTLWSGTCFLRLDQNPSADRILSFRANDIAPTVSRLETAGIQFEQPLQAAPGGGTTAMVRDPDGHIISLSSPLRPKPSAPPK